MGLAAILWVTNASLVIHGKSLSTHSADELKPYQIMPFTRYYSGKDLLSNISDLLCLTLLRSTLHGFRCKTFAVHPTLRVLKKHSSSCFLPTLSCWSQCSLACSACAIMVQAHVVLDSCFGNRWGHGACDSCAVVVLSIR